MWIAVGRQTVLRKEVRKLIHEEIERDIANKAVQYAYRFAGKPTEKAFVKALSIFPGKPLKAGGKKIVHDVGQKIRPTEGKQSVKTLIRQGQGVTSIPLADEGLKDFQKIARKYGVDFAVVKDKNSEPPVYTVFFKAKDQDAITRILQDYSDKQIKKPSIGKGSILEKLKKFKEIVAAIPKKVAEKKKERSL